MNTGRTPAEKAEIYAKIFLTLIFMQTMVALGVLFVVAFVGVQTMHSIGQMEKRSKCIVESPLNGDNAGFAYQRCMNS